MGLPRILSTPSNGLFEKNVQVYNIVWNKSVLGERKIFRHGARFWTMIHFVCLLEVMMVGAHFRKTDHSDVYMWGIVSCPNDLSIRFKPVWLCCRFIEVSFLHPNEFLHWRANIGFDGLNGQFTRILWTGAVVCTDHMQCGVAEQLIL